MLVLGSENLGFFSLKTGGWGHAIKPLFFFKACEFFLCKMRLLSLNLQYFSEDEVSHHYFPILCTIMSWIFFLTNYINDTHLNKILKKESRLLRNASKGDGVEVNYFTQPTAIFLKTLF